ncbi:MAG: PepSY-like domain-containing protein [Bacteroidales bacterium]|nr:PepSY-like domain-containing protein [Bacteroidales bacterium]
MKKVLILTLSLITLSAVACHDRPVTFNDLPQKSQQFLNTYFKNIGLLSAKYDDGEYEVVLKDGTKIEFSRQGEWKEVDCHTKAVPSGIVPTAISNYVKTNFPDNIIVKIERTYNGYDIELDNDLDLKFDKNGNEQGIDY